ncbi:MAG: RNA polymerase-binding protein DksA [Legionellales bacterium]|nr:MAG: RNA polymerase-binding protein DksA [Legionellales bacterium]
MTTTEKTHMTTEQLEHFRAVLLAQKQELMEDVDHTIHDMQEANSEKEPDPNDQASQEETVTLELKVRNRGRKLLKKIDEALQQIDDQSYGFCESCSTAIGVERLEARPTATLCIDCKTLAEISEKRNS